MSQGQPCGTPFIRNREEMGMNRIPCLRTFLFGFCAFACVADAAGSQLVKVVDSFTPVAGEPPGTTFNLTGAAAAYKNGIFVFEAQVGGVKGLWRTGPTAGGFTRLVDVNTAIPSGSGFFRDLLPFRFDGSTLVFRGDDQGEFGGQAGYYAIPIGGGAITTLANQNTLVPPANTTPFGFGIGFPGGTQDYMSLDGGNLVFADNAESGNYAIDLASGQVRAIGTTAYAICEAGPYLALIWGQPEISGNTVSMSIGGGQGSSLYTFPLSGVSGVPDPCATPRERASNGSRIASLNVANPGGGNFDAFKFGTQRISGNTVVFRGGNASGRYGIYSTATDGSGLSELVSTNDAVPGGVGTFQDPVFGFSLELFVLGNEVVVFRGTDANLFQGVYAVPIQGGPVVEVTRAGDILPDGRTVYAAGGAALAPEVFQGDSMYGDRLALRIDFTDPVLGFGSGIYTIDLGDLIFADDFELP